MKKVLIITTSADRETVASVMSHLQKRNIDSLRLDIDKLVEGTTRICYETNKDESIVRLYTNSESIDIHNATSVWYRKKIFFENKKILNKDQQGYASEEIQYLMSGLSMLFQKKDIFWMHTPQQIEYARNKILQLHTARRLDIEIPKTLITNDPSEAKNFFKNHKKIIFKPLNRKYIEISGKKYGIPVKILTEDFIREAAKIRQGPVLLQECIEKKYDLRVTVVGKKVFPIKINSQDFQETTLDWRKQKYMKKFTYSIVTLPKSVEKFCFKMMKRLQIHYGAFDFAVDKQNNHVFFEVNPDGEWYWLELATGARISEAIAQMLINTKVAKHKSYSIL